MKKLPSGFSFLETSVGATWGGDLARLPLVCLSVHKSWGNPARFEFQSWWVMGRNKQRCEATGQIAASIYKLLVGIFYVCLYVYIEIHMHVEKKM